jgi:hypothetical protein
METLNALLAAGLISEADYVRHVTHWRRAQDMIEINRLMVELVARNIK